MAIEVKTIQIDATPTPKFVKFIQSKEFFKIIGGLFLIVLLVGGSYSIYSFISENSNLKAQEQFYQIEKKVVKIISDHNAKTPTANLTLENFGNLIPEAEQILSANKGQSAGAMSALLLADIYSKTGDEEKAISALEMVTARGAIGALVTYRKLVLLGNKAEYEKVITQTEALLKNQNFGFILPELKLNLALCYQKLGQTDKAKSIFKEISEKSEMSSNQSDVGNLPMAPQDLSETKERAKKYLISLEAGNQ